MKFTWNNSLLSDSCARGSQLIRLGGCPAHTRHCSVTRSVTPPNFPDPPKIIIAPPKFVANFFIISRYRNLSEIHAHTYKASHIQIVSHELHSDHHRIDIIRFLNETWFISMLYHCQLLLYIRILSSYLPSVRISYQFVILSFSIFDFHRSRWTPQKFHWEILFLILWGQLINTSCSVFILIFHQSLVHSSHLYGDHRKRLRLTYVNASYHNTHNFILTIVYTLMPPELRHSDECLYTRLSIYVRVVSCGLVGLLVAWLSCATIAGWMVYVLSANLTYSPLLIYTDDRRYILLPL